MVGSLAAVCHAIAWCKGIGWSGALWWRTVKVCLCSIPIATQSIKHHAQVRDGYGHMLAVAGFKKVFLAQNLNQKTEISD